MRNTGKLILSAALSALTFFSFGGCSGRPIGSPECGGVTDKTDHNAPKTIVSKDLTSFYAHFYLRGEWSPGKGDRFYTCEVRTDEQGVLTATVWTDSLQDACVRLPADEKLLATLQSIIDTYKLVGKNGYYRVTAGLPPEFQKCHFNANYASGEKLEFTENNNPTRNGRGRPTLPLRTGSRSRATIPCCRRNCPTGQLRIAGSPFPTAAGRCILGLFMCRKRMPSTASVCFSEGLLMTSKQRSG